MNRQLILEINQRFYDAFNKNDIDLMRRVWLDAPSAQCLHPGWDVLCGFEPILKSWQNIFESGEGLEIRLSNVEVTVSDDLDWVTCQEKLFALSSAGVQLSKVHATNLFKRHNGEWKMILHHASPVRGIPAEQIMGEN